MADTLAAGQQSTLHLQLSSSPPPVADGDEPAPRSLLHSRLPLPGSEQPGPTLGSTAGGPTWQFVLRQQHEAAWLRNWLVEGEREYAPPSPPSPLGFESVAATASDGATVSVMLCCSVLKLMLECAGVAS